MELVTLIGTPLGIMSVVTDGEFVTRIYYGVKEEAKKSSETATAKIVSEQFEQYFNGERQYFDFPIKLDGTEFSKAVWEEMRRVPYGETATYRDIAERIDRPKACRAVGNACNKNPIMLVIPCHRILGKSNKKNYVGGCGKKGDLLTLEERNKNRFSVNEK